MPIRCKGNSVSDRSLQGGTVRTVAATLLIAGCASYDLPGVAWHVQPVLVPAFEDAAAQWCEASDGQYCPYIDPHSVNRVVALAAEDAAGFCGRFAPPEREIAVAVGKRCHIVSTLAHELGHAAGLPDLPAGRGIMGSVDDDSVVTPADCARLALFAM